MRTYTQIEGFVRETLDHANYNKVHIKPGPDVADVPDSTVVLTPFPGAGLQMDGAIDNRAWQVRCIGAQNDYGSAEGIADVLDIAFISHRSSRIGGVWVVSIERVGGSPTPLLVDDGDRTHFVCSYQISVESALSN